MTELEKFADRKRLPISFLAKNRVEETDAGIRFTNGDARARIRARADSHKTFWAKEDNRRLGVYGYNRVYQMAKRNKSVLITEGESDSLTAWFHKLPALGIPGSSMYEKLEHKDVAPFDCVAVIREPDEAGRKFAINVPKRLRELGYSGTVTIVDLPAKDLSELHIRYADDEAEFDRQLAAAIENGKPAEISGSPGGKPTKSLSTVRLDTVRPESVEWLWRSRIPLGKVSLLVGDPGSGKSFASLAIAAAVTTGAALPDGNATKPGNVVAYNAEDGLEDTIRPRAELCGVTLDRFHAIAGTRDAEGRIEPFSLSDVFRVAEFMEELGDVRLVIIDPIASLLAGVDSHRDAEVRGSLQILVELASRTGAAVLGIMHLRKSSAERALYRVGGSIGFTGLARSVLLAGVDPEGGRRVIVPIKQNLAAAVDPVEYRLDPDGRFSWGSTVPELTADRLLAAPSAKPLPATDVTPAFDAASAFLEECLADGKRPATEVSKLAREAGISDATLKRAKEALKVKAHRAGFGKAGRWFWSLPIVAHSMSTYGDENPPPIEAHIDNIGAQGQLVSTSGDSLGTYDVAASASGALSVRSRLCRQCKTLTLAFDMGDGTWLCKACSEAT